MDLNALTLNEKTMTDIFKDMGISFITSFLVVLIATPSLIKVAKMKHLVDEPGEARKLHRRSVPTLGGVMIFALQVRMRSETFLQDTSFLSSS